MYLFAIFDRKMKQYQQQVVAEINAAAYLRNLADGVKQAEGSLIANHPEDFDVMCIGTLDRLSGVITPTVPPQLVENVGDLVKVPVGVQQQLALEA